MKITGKTRGTKNNTQGGGGHLLERGAYKQNGGAYQKEGAKSNNYGRPFARGSFVSKRV